MRRASISFVAASIMFVVIGGDLFVQTFMRMRQIAMFVDGTTLHQHVAPQGCQRGIEAAAAVTSPPMPFSASNTFCPSGPHAKDYQQRATLPCDRAAPAAHGAEAWRSVLDTLVGRGLRRP